MKILLVEDERLIAEELVGQLQALGYADIDVEHNSEDVEVYMKTSVPDLVIMDIELKGSPLDGIALASRVQKSGEVPIIFLSSYSDHQTLNRSKEVSHAHYLVKPCSTRQLFVTIDACLDSFVSSLSSSDMDSKSIPMYSGPQCPLLTTVDYFFIKNAGSVYEKLYVGEINWVTAVRGGLEIHYGKNRCKMLTASLKSFQDQFPHNDLLRVHRSHIINKQKVMWIADKTLGIALGDKTQTIPVSQSYWNDVNHLFKKLKSD